MGKVKAMDERERSLVTQNFRKVYVIASQFVIPPGVQKEDIVQAGMLALCECAVNFDESKGYKFWTYPQHGVRFAMTKTIRHYSEPVSITEYGNQKLRKRKTLIVCTDRWNQPKAYPIDYNRELCNKMTPKELRDDRQDEIQRRIDICDIFKKISQEERRLIQQHFGLGGWDINSLSDIARREGVSRQAIKKRYDRILKKIRKKLRHNE